MAEMWDHISYRVKEAIAATDELRIPIPQSLSRQAADIYTFSAAIRQLARARAENETLDWFQPDVAPPDPEEPQQ